MKKELTAGALTVALVAGMAVAMTSTVTAESEETNVDVEVASTVELDVRPSSLAYTGLETGDFEEVSEDDFFAIELANIGSENISQISAEATMPSANPFGTGDESNYDTGNIIKASLDTTNAGDYGVDVADGSANNFHYLNRLEFTENPEPSYIQTLEDGDFDEMENYDDSDFGTGTHDTGRFRQGNEEYFYVVYHDGEAGSNACDGSESAEMWVGTDEHTPTELGTFDFTNSSSSDVEVYDIAGSDADDIGRTDSSVDVGDESYNVYAFCDGDDNDPGHTIRTRFNVEVTSPVISQDTGEETSNAQQYILDSTGSPLQPGASFPLDMGVQVPLGTAQGDLNEGTVTVLASSEAE